jgi:cytochrome c oxidase subunit 4
MSADTDDVKSHIKTYFAVFGALLVLTVTTVAVSYLDVSIALAVVIAMAVASVKGGLVAAIFMHLNHESKVIYQILALAMGGFVMVMALPTSWWSDASQVDSVWDQSVPASQMAGHHGGHGDHDGHEEDGDGGHGGH